MLPRLAVSRSLLLTGTAIALIVVFASGANWRAASAQTLTVGAAAQVVTDDGGNLNLRAGPSLTATILTSLPDRSFVIVRDGTQEASGFTWQLVEANSFIGWVAAIYLQPLGASTPTPSPTTSPTPSATPTPSPTPAPVVPVTPSVGTGSIVGPLPTNGRPSLVVWGGGDLDAMSSAAAGRGCGLRSVWATANGRLIGYQFGVPAFVNAGWTNQFGVTLPPTTAVMAICGLPGQVTSSSSPQARAGGTTAPPSSQTQPPGPGGNL